MSKYLGSRLEKIHVRMRELAGSKNPADQKEFWELSTEFDTANGQRKRGDLADGVRSGRYRTEGGSVGQHYVGGDVEPDPYAADRDHRPNDPARGQRSAALRTLDNLVDSDRLPARSAETVEQLTRTGSGQEQSWTARVVEATGSDAYLGAFSKLVADPARGHLVWTGEEHAAFQRVEQLRSETRAMSDVDVQGGYLAPLVIDPSVLISSSGSINPLRAISRNVTTISDSWNGISSTGVTAEWLAEGSQSADASPTLGQPTIPVFKASAFVPYSYEVAMDAINLAQELGKLLTDGYQQLTNTAFTTGLGINQPNGVITALAATATSVVNTATGGVLAPGDVYALQNALAPRFSAKAQWCANLSVLNAIRQFVTGSIFTFPELRDNPERLLSRDVSELSNMTGTVASGSKVLLYGDFEHFVIVDRFPSQVEIIQNLFGASQRPTGSRGALLWARVGSDVVVPNAFRLLVA
jgi:HK97 family phage major capsid protein